VAVILSLASHLLAQRTALITPDASPLDQRIAGEIKTALKTNLRIQDRDMTTMAFDSARPETPFNMTTDEARRVGSLIGSDFYILVRSGSQRRAALERADYFESYAALFVVSSRSGRLIAWKLVTAESTTAADAETALVRSIAAASTEIAERIRRTAASEPSEADPGLLEEVPEPGTSAAKGFRPPVPYRRLKPDYTRTAYLYDVAAIVEVTVDLDATGKVQRLEITRWAGYGLDESAISAVNSMNWRPAERAGKQLPVRFLLRYNFKKIEKD
jgi:hypothetical protein